MGRVKDTATCMHQQGREIIVVAVTKHASIDQIRELIGYGHKDLGENRVQVLVQHAAQVDDYISRHRLRATPDHGGVSGEVRWHMIGTLQRNKARRVLGIARLIHSLDSLRLAEEIAVLDNLTGGRFIAGVGRGYQPHELDRFGVSVESSRSRFNDTLQILYKAWTENESFTYEGQQVSVPHETVVWPKPLTKPHPPMWVAGTSVETMELAADWDMMPVTTGLLGEGGHGLVEGCSDGRGLTGDLHSCHLVGLHPGQKPGSEPGDRQTAQDEGDECDQQAAAHVGQPSR